MKRKKTNIPVIYLDALTDDVKEGILENGFTVHKNIIIVWNEKGYSDEIIKFIDGIPEDIRKELLLISHKDDPVDFYWNDKVPSSFRLNHIKIGKKIYPTYHTPYVIKR